MTDPVDTYLIRRQPTASRPLLGLTILLVEDSRFASEAVRLMCLRSGARIRRADCLASAHKHLCTYRPSVAIVDLGLPDGHGEDLIRELRGGPRPVQAVLATSGDPDGAERAFAAGAQGFLEKPVRSLGDFQQTVLHVLPPEARPLGLRAVTEDTVDPDMLAFRDDLAHVAELLTVAESEQPIDYIAQFVSGVARSAQDGPLCAAAEAILRAQARGAANPVALSRLRNIVQSRLERQIAI
ncbi:response regulator [Mangrovicoccus algicola]|uniref:Response regulator n=1 Tax=Mangrovicoccus algicola TaxID=2771008 RepID=A0A8J6ZAC4_9RHOB|nr:response regulator [Mangrovicoccus algicola]MBE3639320.1 response regulator [Mangrovicoccus algicola]